MRIDHAVVVGAGGTGSHLLEPLARLLAFHPAGPRGKTPLLVVDGDAYDAGNASRQLGCQPGVNKAVAWSERLSEILPGTIGIPSYVDGATFGPDVVDGIRGYHAAAVLVVLAVDNNATRRGVMEALNRDAPDALLCLSPGNDLAHGNLLAWARVGHRDLSPYPLGLRPDGQPLYPELARPTDRLPGGCAARAPATPQLLVANAFAAALTLAAVTNWLDDRPIPDRAEFDARALRARSLTPDGRARPEAFAVQLGGGA